MNKSSRSAWSLFLQVISFAKPFRKPLVVIFLCILGTALATAISLYYFSEVFKLFQKHGQDITYWQGALMLMLTATGFALLRVGIIYYQNKTEVKKLDLMVPNHLSYTSISKFFSFSNGQHINEHSGIKQTIVNNGTESIRNQINLIIIQFFPAAASLLVAFGVLLYTHWSIGCFFVCGGILYCYMLYEHNKRLIPGTRRIRDRKQLNSRLITELYRFVNLVKNENHENRSLTEVMDVQQKHQDIFAETWLPGTNRVTLIRLVSNLVSYSARIYAVYLFYMQKIDIGMVFLAFGYSTVFVDSLWQITNIHKSFLMDRINIERYFELLEIKPDILQAENPIRPEKLEGEIEFKNVTFQYLQRVKSYEKSYDDQEDIDLEKNPVLNKISLVIKKGEKIGIVGESGSGKSTLASLLRREFDPREGQILIDGNDLRLLDLDWYLQNIGNVEQEVILFDRSIRDNILFGLNGKAKNFPEEKLRQIAKMVRIDGFFDRLEHGFDTIVGEKGVKLSGGERQRIGIARALAKDPSILIFDEATSALDSMSEKIVQQSIDEASKGKTAIIIAHRLSTVRNCSRILVLRHGILLAEGSHEELLENCEYYADLVHHQMMS